MFKLDHIMIETKDPQGAASMVSAHFGLPLAWPLIEKEEYTSIGVNFGYVNFEFIDFRTRFGIPGKSYTGLSGLAFRIDGTEEDVIKKLTDLELDTRTGEKAETHTTFTIEEEQFFPTIFLVKYHFDTSGWHTRLRNEFHACDGGKFHLIKLESFIYGTSLPDKVKNEFGLSDDMNQAPTSKIIFKTDAELKEPHVISGLIQGLDIVLI